MTNTKSYIVTIRDNHGAVAATMNIECGPNSDPAELAMEEFADTYEGDADTCHVSSVTEQMRGDACSQCHFTDGHKMSCTFGGK